MRILVCGGRNYADRAFVFSTLDAIMTSSGVEEVIEGGATGADAFAGQWADLRRVKHTRVDADWKRFGRSAGPIRNMEMLRLKPDAVVAFAGGPGTAHMMLQAKKANVQVLDYTKH